MEKLTKKERVLQAVRGERPEELPYTFWTHLPGIDLDPEKLAAKTEAFYRKYDVDLVKTMNNGMYSVEDFGCTVDYSGIAKGGVASIAETPIKRGDDWAKIEPVTIAAPALSRELHSLELLLKKLREEQVPVIFTVFSPVTTAEKLSKGKLFEHVEQGYSRQVKSALEAITQTTCALVKKAIELGADGIYFASQLSDYAKCDEDFYRVYGVPYDLRVLSSSEGSCDALHAHGDSIMFDILKSYPVDIFNWHVFDSEPDIARGSAETGRCIMGGLRRSDITQFSPSAIDEQIEYCLTALNGRGHILSPGCVIRYPLDEHALNYVRKAKIRIANARR